MHSCPRPKSAREAGGSTGAVGCTHDRAKRWRQPGRWVANAIPSLPRLRGLTSLTNDPAEGGRGATPEIETRQIAVEGQLLQVGIRPGSGSGPPLVLFNGIGANWELAKPFLEALTSTTAIIFDVPGVGGSPRPLLPYRPSTLARLAADLVAELGCAEIDVAGVSWGGGIAQQFAHQYPKLCRRLVLAATAPGFTMVPASPSVLWKMATPRRYTDKTYLNGIAADIYGGAFRDDPSLIGRHAAAMRGARKLGYLYQLLAMSGWTSLPWLWSLPQSTLVLMGRDDPLVPPINGHILAGLIPNAELQMIEDGHLFIVTRPAETAALIEAFLADASRQVEPSSPLSRMANWVRGLVSTFGERRPHQS